MNKLAMLVVSAALALLSGCAAESAKIVEGTDLSVGFSLPGMEGEANFTMFNWLSGFKTTTAESSRVKLRYTCTETNSYFGVITTQTQKQVDATITPVLDEADDADGADNVEGGKADAATASTAKAETATATCTDGSCTDGTCSDGSSTPK